MVKILDLEENFGADRDRTDGLVVANDALSQLSYSPKGGGILTEDVVFNNTPQCPQPVFPGYFFSFLLGAAIIRNAHFINAYAFDTGKFGSDLGLKTETVFRQRNRLDELPTHHLVTGFHIRQVEVGKHVGEFGQEFIADTMPVK